MHASVYHLQLNVRDAATALPFYRALLGYPDETPGLHDKLICLRNSRKRGLLNGKAERARGADLVMALRPTEPGAAGAAGGNARFEIHFEKTRQRVPLFPILAELQTVDGAGVWRWDAACRVDRLAALVRQGLSRRDVCEALGIERSWFFRLKAEARARGLLPPKGMS